MADNYIKEQRDKVLSNSDQLTLGKLIKLIKPLVEKYEYKEEGDIRVVFDFEYLYPTGINSWRGDYCELALSFNTGEEKPFLLKDFYSLLNGTLGGKFTGYKGGDYIMDGKTPIWVANYGKSGSTAVIGVLDNKYEIVILTGHREY